RGEGRDLEVEVEDVAAAGHGAVAAREEPAVDVVADAPDERRPDPDPTGREHVEELGRRRAVALAALAMDVGIASDEARGAEAGREAAVAVRRVAVVALLAGLDRPVPAVGPARDRSRGRRGVGGAAAKEREGDDGGGGAEDDDVPPRARPQLGLGSEDDDARCFTGT